MDQVSSEALESTWTKPNVVGKIVRQVGTVPAPESTSTADTDDGVDQSKVGLGVGQGVDKEEGVRGGVDGDTLWQGKKASVVDQDVNKDQVNAYVDITNEFAEVSFGVGQDSDDDSDISHDYG